MIMLAKQHGYYAEDPWDSYEDDWALANHRDIWGPNFTTKFFPSELSQEDIDTVSAMFEKWNNVVEHKLTDLGARKFIGGKKPSIGDFVTFSVYINYVFNENTKSAELRRALQEKVEKTPRVQAYVQNMKEEMKEHLAKRIVATL